MIEILVAPIGGGKSTYAAKRAREGAIVINDDAIVTMVHGGDYGLYQKRLKPLYKLVENQILTTGMLMGVDIVIDRPNYRRRTRMRYTSLAHSFEVDNLHVPCRCILWPWTTPEESASRRHAHDDRGHPYEHWLKAAKNHYANYEEPTLDEGYVEIVTPTAQVPTIPQPR